MKERDWSINTALTAVPLTTPHCGGNWQSTIAFVGSCTLSEYFISSYPMQSMHTNPVSLSMDIQK